MQASTFYLFQCAHTDTYAFSIDKTGCNIPRTLAHAAWFLRADLTPQDIVDDMEDALAEVSRRGFCLLRQKTSKFGRAA